MKLFWLLITVMVLVAADDESSTGQTNGDDNGDDNGFDNDTNGNEDEGTATIEGRTRKNKAGKQQSRFFGGLSPVGGLGVNPALTGGFGVNPTHAGGFGFNPALTGGFGVNPALTGGFGVNPALTGGFGVNPAVTGGFGVNPALGGIHPGIAPVAPPAGCRYWCKTPEGQAYCCENVHQPQSAVGTKPGFCPPVRPTCPLRSFQPPFTCSSDGGCGGLDKCCFDRCLGEHVCKPAVGLGFGFGR